MEKHLNSINHFVTIESNVLHQFESYLKRFSRKDIFLSLHETGGLKICLKLEFQSYVLDDVFNKLVSAHCTAMSNILTVTDENHKHGIFPILPFNVPQS